MNFQTLTKIETPDTYLDTAFRRGKEMAEKTREKSFRTRLMKSQNIEIDRVKIVKKNIIHALNHILTSFPSIDALPPFYLDMIKLTLEYPQLKRSLGGVKWCVDNIEILFNRTLNEMKKTEDIQKINDIRRAFYGRLSSYLRQIAPALKFLDESRKVMRAYPSIKTSIKTIAIAGYPNVGKSTLLKALTSADPEIKNYAFTTKRINLGYLKKGHEKIQLVDTPGALHRPLKSLNAIEQQALLVLKHLAEKIVVLVDTTESCGYPLEKQLAIYHHFKKTFKVPVLLVVAKSDLPHQKPVKEEHLAISAEKGIGMDKLLDFF